MPDPAGRPRCYVASPLGFTDAGRHYYKEIYLPALSTVVEPVDPWALSTTAEFEAAQREGRARDLALDVGRRNAEAIDSCELLVAHVDGQEVDSGTAAEVGYAMAKGLRCFGVRSDLRTSGEHGATVNLQLEYFIVASGGSIVATLEDLIQALSKAELHLSD